MPILYNNSIHFLGQRNGAKNHTKNGAKFVEMAGNLWKNIADPIAVEYERGVTNLSRRKDLNIDRPLTPSANNSTSERTTITKSKQFQPSLKRLNYISKSCMRGGVIPCFA